MWNCYHGNDPRFEAGDERHREVEPGHEHEQRPVSGGKSGGVEEESGQGGRHSVGLAVGVGVHHPRLAVEKAPERFLGMLRRRLRQPLENRGRHAGSGQGCQK